jgi:hypothetical protein
MFDMRTNVWHHAQPSEQYQHTHMMLWKSPKGRQSANKRERRHAGIVALFLLFFLTIGQSTVACRHMPPVLAQGEELT